MNRNITYTTPVYKMKFEEEQDNNVTTVNISLDTLKGLVEFLETEKEECAYLDVEVSSDYCTERDYHGICTLSLYAYVDRPETLEEELERLIEEREERELKISELRSKIENRDLEPF